MTVLGATQTVLVCVPGSSGIQGACPSGSVETVTQAYLVSPTNATFLDVSAEPFDTASAAGLFTAGFGATLAFYLLSLSIGQILNMVKRG